VIDCVVAPVDQTLPIAEDEVRVIEVPGQNEAGPVMVGVAGGAFAVTAKAADVAEQPLALVTVTEYEPAAETVIDCVVAPVDQALPVAEDDVRMIVLPVQKEEGPVIVGVACAGFAVTAKAADVAEQPFALVTVTEYEPAAETVIDCVVAPVDQALPVAEDDVSVMVLPVQNELGPLMVGVAGGGFAVTAKAAEVALQPLALATATVYEPAAETVIDGVVAPVDQRFPVAEDDVSVIVLPVQKDAGPLIVGVGTAGFAVTAKAADVALQPLASVTVTVNEPAADTVIDCVVAPVDQTFPVAEEDVSVIVLPVQKDAGPVMVGVGTAGFAVTAMAADVALQPLALVTVTVYEPAADTVIDCVVAPVDQTFPVVEEEVSVIVLPVQKDAGPVMVGVAGGAFAVTANAVEIAEQPLALVTVTEYDPAAETVIDCVTAPVDQRLPVSADDVSVIVLPVQKDAGPLMVGVAGGAFAVTANAVEVAEHPVAFVTVTVNEPAADTVIDCVVAPVDQTFPVAEDDVSVMVLPVQNELGPLMVGVAGGGFAVTAKAADVALQPLALVTVTVYEPAADTVIDCVVAPVDQTFPVADEDVSVIVLPVQKLEGPLIVGVGGRALTVTAKAADVAEQPLALVTLTVNDPAADTVIDCVVAPVDQRFPVADEDVSVIVPPAQKEAGPLMVGVGGRAFAVTANAADVAEQPLALVTVTL